MLRLKMTALTLAIVLILGGIAASGCGPKRTETVFIKPDCRLPDMVTEADLPDVDVNAVYDALESYHGAEKGRAMAEALRARERLLVDSILEHRAILRTICGDDSRPPDK